MVTRKVTFHDREMYEAMLYYLFIMSDGEKSEEEMDLFSSICKEMKLRKDSKKEVMDYCDEILRGRKSVLNLIKEEELSDKASKRWRQTIDKSQLAKIIWNLIALGYRDDVYSKTEEAIVKYLYPIFEIPKETYLEFLEIADTIEILEKQGEWVEDNIGSKTKKEDKLEELKKQCDNLTKQVHIAIREQDF